MSSVFLHIQARAKGVVWVNRRPRVVCLTERQVPRPPDEEGLGLNIA